MDSMIYGVSRDWTNNVSYNTYGESNSDKEDKPGNVYSHFNSNPKVKPLTKPSCFKSYKNDYSANKAKVVKNSRKSNKKGPKKLWVPRKYIFYRYSQELS